MAIFYYTTFQFSNNTKDLRKISSARHYDGHNNTLQFDGDDFLSYYNALTQEQKESLECLWVEGNKICMWRLKNNLFYCDTAEWVTTPLKRQQTAIAEINKSRQFVSEETIIDTCYIWQAEDDKVIGSKVGNSMMFREFVKVCIESHDPSNDRARGQHEITLSDAYIANSEITCGVGLNTSDPNDYVLREHRGRVQPFLDRRYALPVDWCAVIVYDREAYLADPQMPAEERERVLGGNATHFLIALLANAKDVPNAYGTYRLVSNLCGGNNAFADMSLAEFKVEAQKALDYQDKWCVVAD
tara:strand:+ start:590 stop:1489 length:900 start_codon:yes stop_codon:yes gene_type:complete